MLIDMLKNTSTKDSCLSKIDTLGSFCFWTFIVSFESLDSHHVDGIDAETIQKLENNIEVKHFHELQKVIPLVFHEYTHFVDATSTLWGLRHISKINACYSVPNDNEKMFRVLKDTVNYVGMIRLPDYYTVIDESVSRALPWSSSITSGVIFDSNGNLTDKNVMFVRFMNEMGRVIVRSPISVVSLLEASAMAKEIEIEMLILGRICSEGRIVEIRNFQKKSMEHIYDHRLTEYSVCAHMVANMCRIKDLSVASLYAGLLSRVVLNASKKAFLTAAGNLRKFTPINWKFGDENQFERLENGLKQMNHGTLFYLLSLGLSSVFDKREPILIGIDKSLRILGLSLDKIRRSAVDEINSIGLSMHNGNTDLKELFAAGVKNFNVIFHKNLTYPLGDLILPPSLLGDSTQYYFFKQKNNTISQLNLNCLYDNLVTSQIRAENFSKACIAA